MKRPAGKTVAVVAAVVLVMASSFAVADTTILADWGTETEWNNAQKSQGMVVEGSGSDAQIRLAGDYFDEYNSDPRGVSDRITVTGNIDYDSGEGAVVYPGGDIGTGGWSDDTAWANPFDKHAEIDTWVRVNGTYGAIIGKGAKDQTSGDRIRFVLRVPEDEVRIGQYTGGSIGLLNSTATSVPLNVTDKYWLHIEKNETANELRLEAYQDDGGTPGARIGVVTTGMPSHVDGQELYWAYTSHSASNTDDQLHDWGIVNGSFSTDWKQVGSDQLLNKIKAWSTTGDVLVRNSGQPSTVQDTITVPGGTPTLEYDMLNDTANYSVAVMANDQNPEGSTNTNWTAAGGSSIMKDPASGDYYIVARHRYADGGSKRGLEYEIVKNNTNTWNGPEDWSNVFTENMSDDTRSVEVGVLRHFEGKYYFYLSWSRESDGFWTVSVVNSTTISGLQAKLDDKTTWQHIAGAEADEGIDTSLKDGRVYKTDGKYYLIVDDLANRNYILESTSGGPEFTTVTNHGDALAPFTATSPDIEYTNDGMAMYDNENDRYIYWFSWQNSSHASYWGYITAKTLDGFPTGTYKGSIYTDEPDAATGDVRYADYSSVDNNSQVFTFEWDKDEDRVRNLYIWDYRDDPGGASTGSVPAIDTENLTVNVTVQTSPDQVAITDTDTVTLSGQQGEILDLNITSDTYARINATMTIEGHASTAGAVEQIQLLETTDFRAPVLSNPNPTGPQGNVPSQVSIDVSDPNMAEESVDVTIWHNGNQLKQTTINTNQTVTASIDSVDAGDNQWTVNATDSTGRSTNTTYTYSVGEDIIIRPETNETQVIDDRPIDATFYSLENNTIFETTTNSGAINVSGLPVEGQFIITLEANGYYARTGYSAGVLSSSTMYLLNSSEHPNAPTTIFELEDRTGRFPGEDTVIVIERAFDPNGDGFETYQPVAGDFFGATGTFTFTGQKDVRYRIKVQNVNTGETRIIGPYTPTVDDRRVITIGTVQWPALNESAHWFNVNQTDIGGNTTRFRLQYLDTSNTTTEVCYTVKERYNESNVFASDCVAGTYGQFVADVEINETKIGDGVIVSYNATQSDGETFEGKRLVGGNSIGIPIDPRWLGSAFVVFVPMVGLLYGNRTAVLGTWVMMAITAVIMLFQFITLPPMALAAGVVITFGGTLRARNVESGGLP